MIRSYEGMQGGIMRTRSQAEIVGITIVMVLIMLGIVFVIKFVILPEDSGVKDIYKKSEIPANFLNALIKTTTPCNNLRMTDLIQGCAETSGTWQERVCPSDGFICMNASGCQMCTYLNNSIQYIINSSLAVMNIKYDFYICSTDSVTDECLNKSKADTITSIEYGNCRKSKAESMSSEQVPVQTGAGPRMVKIYIC